MSPPANTAFTMRVTPKTVSRMTSARYCAACDRDRHMTAFLDAPTIDLADPSHDARRSTGVALQAVVGRLPSVASKLQAKCSKLAVNSREASINGLRCLCNVRPNGS